MNLSDDDGHFNYLKPVWLWNRPRETSTP